MSDMKRCKVDAAVFAPALEYSRALGRGLVVDLDEPAGEDGDGRAYALRDLVAGDWFQEVDAPLPELRAADPTPAPAPTPPADTDEPDNDATNESEATQ